MHHHDQCYDSQKHLYKFAIRSDWPLPVGSSEYQREILLTPGSNGKGITSLQAIKQDMP
ncbi:MAG: hypothetical protein R3C14_50580 [Caldilineaceae bacterium]